MSDLKETILTRVNIAELIGQYVTLIPMGRKHKACCPFHDEKTPSFNVDSEKGLFYCFGCKAGGNVIDFVMRQENLEFLPAMEWLANRHGIEIPRSEGQKRVLGQKERLLELNEAAWKFFRRKLTDPEGEAARAYIDKRGIDKGIASEFGLGYAPKEWSALTDMLLAKGARASELESLGLIKPRTSGGGHYDSFRHRLIFPIHSVTGGVIGFGGRALSDEDNPKYLNTSNTPLYEKSRVLYNLNRARSLSREEGIVVVEGYMDVIGLAQQGIANSVASCGTALTKDHVALLRRYAESVHLAFDGDNAGRSAAWNGGRLFLLEGIDARIVVIPGGMDPDDFASKHGSAAWKGLLSEARGVVQFWLEHQLQLKPDAGLPQRRAWITELRPLWAAIRDELLREEIRRQVADQLLIRPEEVGEVLSGRISGTPRGRGIDKERLARDNARNRQRIEKRKGLVEIKPGGIEDLEDKVVRHRAGMVDNARNMASMQGSVPIEREVLRRLCGDEEFRLLYSRLAEPQWFVLNVHREIYLAMLDSLENIDKVLHDDRWRSFFAELLSRSDDGVEAEPALSLITRHSNMYQERHVAQLIVDIGRAEQSGDVVRVSALHQELIETKKRIRPVQGIGGGVASS